MLWLLAVIPLLIGLYILLLRRRKKSALRYASLSMVKDAMGKGAGFRRHVPPLLLLLSITVLVFAVARPAAYVTLPSSRGTVILAMDISGSMRASDIQPTRLVAAQDAAREFIAAQPKSVRIGVVAFAATAALVQPPTQNREDLLSAISRFRLQRGTAVGNGILASLSAIFEGTDVDPGVPASGGYQAPQNGGPRQRGGSGAPLGEAPQSSGIARDPVAPGSYSSAVVILLTDGQTNTGPDPLETAQKAADLGIRVFTVGLGTTQGNIVGFYGRSMRVQLDESSLKAIAERTHARYFRAGNESELKDIYKLLSNQLVLEREKSEITALFAAGGALIALIAAVLSLLWFSRVL